MKCLSMVFVNDSISFFDFNRGFNFERNIPCVRYSSTPREFIQNKTVQWWTFLDNCFPVSAFVHRFVFSDLPCNHGHVIA